MLKLFQVVYIQFQSTLGDAESHPLQHNLIGLQSVADGLFQHYQRNRKCTLFTKTTQDSIFLILISIRNSTHILHYTMLLTLVQYSFVVVVDAKHF